MQQKISTRMLAHACQRYQWYVVHRGFPGFDTFHDWQYNTNKIIEGQGIEYLRNNLWIVGDTPKVKLNDIHVTAKNTIFGESEALPIDTLQPKTKYVVLPRSLSRNAYGRIEQVRIHRVNVNVTLEALLNFHIFAQHDAYFMPVVLYIDRANLEIHVESLFRFMPNYESMSADYYSITLQSMQSEENSFSPPKSSFHCAKCIFRRMCQKDLVSHS